MKGSELLQPRCAGMNELPDASQHRAQLSLLRQSDPLLAKHLSLGLAYTTGSALGCDPPSIELCLEAFQRPNKVGHDLTTGARAWSKHAPRFLSTTDAASNGKGWWGRPSGPVSVINENALTLFWRIMDNATWRNLHWLPHCVLVYEVRIEEGYGLRWSQNCEGDESSNTTRPWTFRGFVEPMMENGHEVGWRH